MYREDEFKRCFRSIPEIIMKQGETDIADNKIAEDYVEYIPVPPQFTTNSQGLKALVLMLRAAFPNLLYDADRSVTSARIGENQKAVPWTIKNTEKTTYQENVVMVKGLVHAASVPCSLDTVDTLVHSQSVDPRYPEFPVGAQGAKLAILMFRNAFPDLYRLIETLIAEKDAVIRFTLGHPECVHGYCAN